MEYEVKYDEMIKWDAGTYLLVDMRDEMSVSYGMIPGAVNISSGELETGNAELPSDKKIVVYCMKGILSVDTAAQLREKGFEAYSLSDGYYSYLSYKMKEDMKRENERKEANPDSHVCKHIYYA